LSDVTRQLSDVCNCLGLEIPDQDSNGEV